MLVPITLALSALAPQNVPNLPSSTGKSIEPVAEVVIQSFECESFVLQATVPVPKGTLPPGGRPPLQVVDYDGRIVEDTQVEVVSRYADPNDGADVIEVIARVRPDPEWPDGAYETFQVMHLERGSVPDPGSPDVFDLIEGPKHVPLEIQSLIADPDSILVVATDPLGNPYVARPLLGQQGMKTYRYGPYMSTLRTYEIMQSDDPASLPAGAYPHLFGVHAYLSTVSGENLLRLDLRLNNGADGFHPVNTLDETLGPVYFQQIDLYVAKGATTWWARQQFPDPFSFDPLADRPTEVSYGGREYWAFPIVKRLAPGPGKMHLFPCKSQAIRRMVISPIENAPRAFEVLNGRGNAYATKRANSLGMPYWSWWNPETARYFPQRYRLAAIGFGNANYFGKQDMRASLKKWFEECRDAVAAGTEFPDPEKKGSLTQLGWARPMGVPDGGATGGLGIQFVDGDRTLGVGSTDGYRYLQLRHRLHGDRMPNVVWNLIGETTGQDKWLVNCPTCDPLVFPAGPNGTPNWTRIVHDMNQGIYDSDFCPGPGWAQNMHVNQNGLKPGYETDPDNFYRLTAYYPHNTFHHIRYTRLPMALAWIGNDPVAKDDVRAQAEMFRLTYTEYTNQAGTAYAASLANDMQLVFSKPRWGYHTGRGEGWGITCVNAAFAMSNDAWRLGMKDWYSRVVDTLDRGLALATDPNYVDSTGTPYEWGTLIAHQSSKLYGVLPGDPRARQTWEEMIVQSAMRGLVETVYADSSPLAGKVNEVRRRSYYGLLAPVSWNENGRHIWETCPVSDDTHTVPVKIYNCDPTANGCNGQTPLPGGPYAPKWRDDHYSWPAMADGMELTGDSLFLQSAHRMLTGNPCPSSCPNSIRGVLQSRGDPTWEPDYSEWSNKSVLLGRVQ